jgi:hypothetical protein
VQLGRWTPLWAYGTAFLVAHAPQAQAQYPSELVPYTLGVGGGWVRPVGPFANRIATGYHIDLGFGVEPHSVPLGVRFDATYDGFVARGNYISTIRSAKSGSASIVGGQVDLVVGHPSGKGIRPYALGGIGIYGRTVRITRDTASGTVINDPILGFVNVRPATRLTGISDTELAAGWNAGAGVAFGVYPADFFIEVRYHDISTAVHHTRILPVTLGFRF